MKIETWKPLPVAGFFSLEEVGTVEAVQLTRNNILQVATWCGGEVDGRRLIVPSWKRVGDPNGDRKKLKTVERTIVALPGDYVVKWRERFHVAVAPMFETNYQKVVT